MQHYVVTVTADGGVTMIFIHRYATYSLGDLTFSDHGWLFDTDATALNMTKDTPVWFAKADWSRMVRCFVAIIVLTNPKTPGTTRVLLWADWTVHLWVTVTAQGWLRGSTYI